MLPILKLYLKMGHVQLLLRLQQDHDKMPKIKAQSSRAPVEMTIIQ